MDLITINDIPSVQIKRIFSSAAVLKKDRLAARTALAGKTLALIFQKPSNRTRVSFDVGMYELGGNTIYLSPDEINIGVREAVKDVAMTLSRYVHGIVLRTYAHKNVVDLARWASVPVINGLSDYSHPCQALADVFTVLEALRGRKNITLAYVGDGNNVCNSLLFACSKVGIHMNVATPQGYQPQASVVEAARSCAASTGARITVSQDPLAAVRGADVVYTDVWTSMGQEAEAAQRSAVFKPFQVNAALCAHAKPDVRIMHCLPAHRGEEITDDMLDSKYSIVFDQAENRLHVQKAVLKLLLGS
jgi:ornithine carbamoyltransferase